MDAFEITATLIEPSAGLVDGTGWIFLPNEAGNPVSIELPPALIKRNPYGDRRSIVQMFDGIQTLFCPCFPSFFGLAAKQFVVAVFYVAGNMGKKGRKVADDGQGIRRAAAYHILPYNHSQPVAMVIPA